MRTFVRVQVLASTHGDLAMRVGELEQATEALAKSHDTLNHNTRAKFKQSFDALHALMTSSDPTKRSIGFVAKPRGNNARAQG